MSSNRAWRFGPVALTNSAANLFNPPTTTGGVNVTADITGTYVILRHLRVVNKTASAATFSMWLGATGGSAAGTEVIGTAKSVPANDAYDWYGLLRITPTDFLTALASANTTLTVQGEGEIGVAG